MPNTKSTVKKLPKNCNILPKSKAKFRQICSHCVRPKCKIVVTHIEITLTPFRSTLLSVSIGQYWEAPKTMTTPTTVVHKSYLSVFNWEWKRWSNIALIGGSCFAQSLEACFRTAPCIIKQWRAVLVAVVVLVIYLAVVGAAPLTLGQRNVGDGKVNAGGKDEK